MDIYNPKNLVLRFYGSVPNLPLAYISLVLYTLFSIFFAVRVYRTKSARFLYILSFTALMEAAGYAMRIVCAVDYTDLGRFLGSTVLLLLAPIFLALVNYKSIGEIIRLSNVNTNKFFLKTKFVTWFFFSSDLLAFLFQGAGSSMQTSIKAKQTGQVITLIGLSVQLFFLACFAVITIYVHRNPKYHYEIEGNSNPKKRFVLCLYITLAFIYIRSIYRVAEYATGYTGPIARSEWAFYVFDTLMILSCFVVYSFIFIGNYLPKHNEVEMINYNEKTHHSSMDHLEKNGDVESN